MKIGFGRKGRFICYATKSRIIRCIIGVILSACVILVTTAHGRLFGRTENEDLLHRQSVQWAETDLAPPPAKSVILVKNALFQENKRPSASGTPIKILCYILLSRSKVKVARIIKATWGSHCDKLLFFGGYEYPGLPVTFLNASEGYENLWGKARAALLYLLEDPKFKDFQYFLKADDDTFVIIENLRKFLRGKSEALRQPVWFGFKLKHKRMIQGYMSGGAGYVFNYAALDRVGPILTRRTGNNSARMETDCNIDGEYGIEDLELGKCFQSAGVANIDTADDHNRERFLPMSYEVFLNGGISSFHWIWSQAWNRVRTGDKCCSPDLITMHEVSPSQMKTLYYLLYKIHHRTELNSVE